MRKPSVWGIVGTGMVALAASGCGSDDDGDAGPNIAGIYQVTRHTLNSSACDVEGADVADPPYFQLTRESFLGATFFTTSPCTAPEAASCTEGSLGGFSFYTPRGAGWAGEVYASSSGGEGSPCSLYAIFSTATPTDGGIRLEEREHREQDAALTGDACDVDVAEARGTSMPCTSFEVYEGTLVQ